MGQFLRPGFREGQGAAVNNVGGLHQVAPGGELLKTRDSCSTPTKARLRNR